MNKREATALVNLIRYIKREWKRQSEILQANRKLEWSRPGGAEQAWHDALEAVVHFYGLDIKVDMSPLPEDFDIKKALKKGV